jgi:hypothetical protein
VVPAASHHSRHCAILLVVCVLLVKITHSSPARKAMTTLELRVEGRCLLRPCWVGQAPSLLTSHLFIVHGTKDHTPGVHWTARVSINPACREPPRLNVSPAFAPSVSPELGRSLAAGSGRGELAAGFVVSSAERLRRASCPSAVQIPTGWLLQKTSPCQPPTPRGLRTRISPIFNSDRWLWTLFGGVPRHIPDSGQSLFLL